MESSEKVKFAELRPRSRFPDETRAGIGMVTSAAESGIFGMGYGSVHQSEKPDSPVI